MNFVAFRLSLCHFADSEFAIIISFSDSEFDIGIVSLFYCEIIIIFEIFCL